MDEINKQIEIQNKLNNLVKERQTQLAELKLFFDKNNKKLYKDIVLLNLYYFEEIFNSKNEYRFRVENIYSLALSLSKLLDLNNSAKSVSLLL
jgi:hypothetical protein